MHRATRKTLSPYFFIFSFCFPYFCKSGMCQPVPSDLFLFPAPCDHANGAQPGISFPAKTLLERLVIILTDELFQFGPQALKLVAVDREQFFADRKIPDTFQRQPQVERPSEPCKALAISGVSSSSTNTARVLLVVSSRCSQTGHRLRGVRAGSIFSIIFRTASGICCSQDVRRPTESAGLL